eukprot:323260-Amphidinium_carterae.3
MKVVDGHGEPSGGHLATLLAALEHPVNIADPATQCDDPCRPSLYADAVMLEKIAMKTARDLERWAGEQEETRKTLETNLHVCAELSLRHQSRFLQELRTYVSRLHVADDLEACAFIEHTQIDETPLQITVVSDGERHVERARLFVVERGWQMLLREKGSCHESSAGTSRSNNYFLLSARQATCLRTAATCTGENIHAVLRSTEDEEMLEASKQFKFHMRLTEADGAGANPRAEKLFMDKERGTECIGQLFTCMVHKCHAAAEKTWQVTPVPPILSGVVHIGLFFLSPHTFEQFRKALRGVLASWRVIAHRDGRVCPPEHTSYRMAIVRFFGPSAQQEPRRRSTLDIISSRILNGNWKQHGVLEHYCSGCCTNDGQLRETIVKWVSKLLVIVRPTVFQKNNWSDWSRGLRAPGLLHGCHGLFQAAFESAFARCEPCPEDAAKTESAWLEQRSTEGAQHRVKHKVQNTLHTAIPKC